MDVLEVEATIELQAMEKRPVVVVSGRSDGYEQDEVLDVTN